MRIIDAFWEKRNLDVDCTEVHANNGDTLADFREAISGLESGYQVVRVPSGRTDMLLLAQALGFQTIEMNVQLSRKTSNYQLPAVYKRFEPHFEVVRADDEGCQKVLDRIKDGEIFVSDKVAKDPSFSASKSGNRYYHWSRDVINQGGQLYLAVYKGEHVGFGLNVSGDGTVFNAFLGGIFPEHANKGLGFLPLHANMMSAIWNGGTRVITGVSSNNLPILRLHMLFGFDIQEMTYILIKHMKDDAHVY